MGSNQDNKTAVTGNDSQTNGYRFSDDINKSHDLHGALLFLVRMVTVRNMVRSKTAFLKPEKT